MQELLCPLCGAPVEPRGRECSQCGATLLAVSLQRISTRRMQPGVIERALSHWQGHLAQSPNSADVHYALGLIHLNQERRDQALAHFRRAVYLAPNAPEMHFNLAICILDDGACKAPTPESAELVRALGAAVKLDPDFAEARAFQHFFEARNMVKEDPQTALKEYQAAVRVCSDIGLFHNNLGHCYQELGDREAAERHYRRAIELDPQSAVPHTNLCLMCFDAGEPRLGLAHGRTAVALAPLLNNSEQQAVCLCNLALCLWQTGSRKEARAMMQEALNLDPTDETLRVNMNRMQDGCFIATAAAGREDHPLVHLLRCFRDEVLVQSRSGRWVANLYRVASPPLADVIARSRILRRIVLLGLVAPAAWIVRVLMHLYKRH